MRQPLRIVVSGYYGCGNLGDEAVLAGILYSFRVRRPDMPTEFTVLSANPAVTRRVHGVNAIPRMGPAALWRSIKECRLLISGGGSLFQDVTSLRSLLYYAMVPHFAFRLKRPVMLYAQGVGPLRRPIAQRIVRGVANRAAVVSVRDEASAELLRQIGVRRAVEVTADPAFALPVGDAGPLMREFGLERGALLGFALRPWPAQVVPVSAFARMVEVAAQWASAHPVFIPLHPPGDLELAEHIARASQLPVTLIRRRMAPQEGIALIAQMKALAAMRLHALIFAAMAGVPSVTLAYDPKVEAMAKRLEQNERCLPLRGFDADAAGRLLADAALQSENIKGGLRERAAELARQSLRNVDLAFEAASLAAGV
ncbi:MAG: polysaccharide pyruvyl transferase CsaB [Chthonomonadales bacterium]